MQRQLDLKKDRLRSSSTEVRKVSLSRKNVERHLKERDFIDEDRNNSGLIDLNPSGSSHTVSHKAHGKESIRKCIPAANANDKAKQEKADHEMIKVSRGSQKHNLRPISKKGPTVDSSKVSCDCVYCYQVSDKHKIANVCPKDDSSNHNEHSHSMGTDGRRSSSTVPSKVLRAGPPPPCNSKVKRSLPDKKSKSSLNGPKEAKNSKIPPLGDTATKRRVVPSSTRRDESKNCKSKDNVLPSALVKEKLSQKDNKNSSLPKISSEHLPPRPKRSCREQRSYPCSFSKPEQEKMLFSDKERQTFSGNTERSKTDESNRLLESAISFLLYLGLRPKHFTTQGNVDCSKKNSTNPLETQTLSCNTSNDFCDLIPVSHLKYKSIMEDAYLLDDVSELAEEHHKNAGSNRLESANESSDISHSYTLSIREENVNIINLNYDHNGSSPCGSDDISRLESSKGPNMLSQICSNHLSTATYSTRRTCLQDQSDKLKGEKNLKLNGTHTDFRIATDSEIEKRRVSCEVPLLSPNGMTESVKLASQDNFASLTGMREEYSREENGKRPISLSLTSTDNSPVKYFHEVSLSCASEMIKPSLSDEKPQQSGHHRDAKTDQSDISTSRRGQFLSCSTPEIVEALPNGDLEFPGDTDDEIPKNENATRSRERNCKDYSTLIQTSSPVLKKDTCTKLIRPYSDGQPKMEKTYQFDDKSCLLKESLQNATGKSGNNNSHCGASVSPSISNRTESNVKMELQDGISPSSSARKEIPAEESRKYYSSISQILVEHNVAEYFCEGISDSPCIEKSKEQKNYHSSVESETCHVHYLNDRFGKFSKSGVMLCNVVPPSLTKVKEVHDVELKSDIAISIQLEEDINEKQIKRPRSLSQIPPVSEITPECVSDSNDKSDDGEPCLLFEQTGTLHDHRLNILEGESFKIGNSNTLYSIAPSSATGKGDIQPKSNIAKTGNNLSSSSQMLCENMYSLKLIAERVTFSSPDISDEGSNTLKNMDLQIEHKLNSPVEAYSVEELLKDDTSLPQSSSELRKTKLFQEEKPFTSLNDGLKCDNYLQGEVSETLKENQEITRSSKRAKFDENNKTCDIPSSFIITVPQNVNFLHQDDGIFRTQGKKYCAKENKKSRNLFSRESSDEVLRQEFREEFLFPKYKDKTEDEGKQISDEKKKLSPECHQNAKHCKIDNNASCAASFHITYVDERQKDSVSITQVKEERCECESSFSVLCLETLTEKPLAPSNAHDEESLKCSNDIEINHFSHEKSEPSHEYHENVTHRGRCELDQNNTSCCCTVPFSPTVHNLRSTSDVFFPILVKEEEMSERESSNFMPSATTNKDLHEALYPPHLNIKSEIPSEVKSEESHEFCQTDTNSEEIKLDDNNAHCEMSPFCDQRDNAAVQLKNDDDFSVQVKDELCVEDNTKFPNVLLQAQPEECLTQKNSHEELSPPNDEVNVEWNQLSDGKFGLSHESEQNTGPEEICTTGKNTGPEEICTTGKNNAPDDISSCDLNAMHENVDLQIKSEVSSSREECCQEDNKTSLDLMLETPVNKPPSTNNVNEERPFPCLNVTTEVEMQHVSDEKSKPSCEHYQNATHWETNELVKSLSPWKITSSSLTHVNPDLQQKDDDASAIHVKEEHCEEYNEKGFASSSQTPPDELLAVKDIHGRTSSFSPKDNPEFIRYHHAGEKLKPSYEPHMNTERIKRRKLDEGDDHIPSRCLLETSERKEKSFQQKVGIELSTHIREEPCAEEKDKSADRLSQTFTRNISIPKNFRVATYSYAEDKEEVERKCHSDEHSKPLEVLHGNISPSEERKSHEINVSRDIVPSFPCEAIENMDHQIQDGFHPSTCMREGYCEGHRIKYSDKLLKTSCGEFTPLNNLSEGLPFQDHQIKGDFVSSVSVKEEGSEEENAKFLSETTVDEFLSSIDLLGELDFNDSQIKDSFVSSLCEKEEEDMVFLSEMPAEEFLPLNSLYDILPFEDYQIESDFVYPECVNEEGCEEEKMKYLSETPIEEFLNNLHKDLSLQGHKIENDFTGSECVRKECLEEENLKFLSETPAGKLLPVNDLLDEISFQWLKYKPEDERKRLSDEKCKLDENNKMGHSETGTEENVYAQGKNDTILSPHLETESCEENNRKGGNTLRRNSVDKFVTPNALHEEISSAHSYAKPKDDKKCLSKKEPLQNVDPQAKGDFVLSPHLETEWCEEDIKKRDHILQRNYSDRFVTPHVSHEKTSSGHSNAKHKDERKCLSKKKAQKYHENYFHGEKSKLNVNCTSRDVADDSFCSPVTHINMKPHLEEGDLSLSQMKKKCCKKESKKRPYLSLETPNNTFLKRKDFREGTFSPKSNEKTEIRIKSLPHANTEPSHERQQNAKVSKTAKLANKNEVSAINLTFSSSSSLQKNVDLREKEEFASEEHSAEECYVESRKSFSALSKALQSKLPSSKDFREGTYFPKLKDERTGKMTILSHEEFKAVQVHHHESWNNKNAELDTGSVSINPTGRNSLSISNTPKNVNPLKENTDTPPSSVIFPTAEYFKGGTTHNFKSLLKNNPKTLGKLFPGKISHSSSNSKVQSQCPPNEKSQTLMRNNQKSQKRAENITSCYTCATNIPGNLQAKCNIFSSTRSKDKCTQSDTLRNPNLLPETPMPNLISSKNLNDVSLQEQDVQQGVVRVEVSELQQIEGNKKIFEFQDQNKPHGTLFSSLPLCGAQNMVDFQLNASAIYTKEKCYKDDNDSLLQELSSNLPSLKSFCEVTSSSELSRSKNIAKDDKSEYRMNTENETKAKSSENNASIRHVFFSPEIGNSETMEPMSVDDFSGALTEREFPKTDHGILEETDLFSISVSSVSREGQGVNFSDKSKPSGETTTAFNAPVVIHPEYDPVQVAAKAQHVFGGPAHICSPFSRIPWGNSLCDICENSLCEFPEISKENRGSSNFQFREEGALFGTQFDKDSEHNLEQEVKINRNGCFGHSFESMSSSASHGSSSDFKVTDISSQEDPNFSQESYLNWTPLDHENQSELSNSTICMNQIFGTMTEDNEKCRTGHEDKNESFAHVRSPNRKELTSNQHVKTPDDNSVLGTVERHESILKRSASGGNKSGLPHMRNTFCYGDDDLDFEPERHFKRRKLSSVSKQSTSNRSKNLIEKSKPRLRDLSNGCRRKEKPCFDDDARDMGDTGTTAVLNRRVFNLRSRNKTSTTQEPASQKHESGNTRCLRLSVRDTSNECELYIYDEVNDCFVRKEYRSVENDSEKDMQFSPVSAFKRLRVMSPTPLYENANERNNQIDNASYNTVVNKKLKENSHFEKETRQPEFSTSTLLSTSIQEKNVREETDRNSCLEILSLASYIATTKKRRGRKRKNFSEPVPKSKRAYNCTKKSDVELFNELQLSFQRQQTSAIRSHPLVQGTLANRNVKGSATHKRKWSRSPMWGKATWSLSVLYHDLLEPFRQLSLADRSLKSFLAKISETITKKWYRKKERSLFRDVCKPQPDYLSFPRVTSSEDGISFSFLDQEQKGEDGANEERSFNEITPDIIEIVDNDRTENPGPFSKYDVDRDCEPSHCIAKDTWVFTDEFASLIELNDDF